MTDLDYQDKFDQLNALGAGEFAHLNGTLASHLQSTFNVLQKWQASPELCDAGLFHAAYGTAAFDSAMISLSQRQKIADIIGSDAETIVYLYCACDRQPVFERLRAGEPLWYRDRFLCEEYVLDETSARYFCELTAANELELALDSSAFLERHGEGLKALFDRMSHFLSPEANADIGRVFAAV